VDFLFWAKTKVKQVTGISNLPKTIFCAEGCFRWNMCICYHYHRETVTAIVVQVALLSQRGCAMLHVCQQLQRSAISFVTLVPDSAANYCGVR